MAVSCITTPLGNFYSVTDSKIVHLLENYIGYGGETLRQIAENEISIEVLNSEFDIFFKDIKRVLYDNFTMKKKISEYDDRWLVNEIISYSGGDDDNYYRSSLVTILKILENVKTEMLTYDHEMLDNNYFSGIASFLHLLLLHINEFSGEVATAKEGKDYNRVKSRKRILAQEVFDLARRITRSQTYTNEMTHIYESIFFIRQAIELKILETFYIEAVINEKYKRPIKISPDIFIELLNSKDVKLHGIEGVDRDIDASLIKKVHSWTNTFVHSGNGYWFWEVEFVRRTLQDFIFGKLEINKEYLKVIPEKILQCVKEDERAYAKVVMTHQYYQMIR